MAASLSVKDAWNSVALEERLELLARAHADGISAGIGVAVLLGAIAYGFDHIWLLAGSLAGALLSMPLVASYSWRKNKPAVILSYLAVRSVARRYAFGYKVADFSVVLICRGRLRQLFRSEAEEAMARQQESVDFGSTLENEKNVWLCLMKGALVCLSERQGGARLELISVLSHDTVVGVGSTDRNGAPSVVLTATGGQAKGFQVEIHCQYPGCMYVLDRQLRRIVEEHRLIKERQDRQQTAGTLAPR